VRVCVERHKHKHRRPSAALKLVAKLRASDIIQTRLDVEICVSQALSRYSSTISSQIDLPSHIPFIRPHDKGSPMQNHRIIVLGRKNHSLCACACNQGNWHLSLKTLPNYYICSRRTMQLVLCDCGRDKELELE
jgi:hypothetical protein